MKYNKSKIMKRAWELKKTTDNTFSVCLKRAWAEAKNGSKEESKEIADTFEFEMKGRKCMFRATYECTMKTEMINLDGMKMSGKTRPVEISNLVLYVDGREVDSNRNCYDWHLVDGSNKIHGFAITFSNPEMAEKYEKWITEIIDAGKSDEVKEYEKNKKEKEIKSQIAWAHEVIAGARKQKDIPTRAEAKKRMREYNYTMNEGGEGYVPHIYCVEEYNHAIKIIREYEK